MAIAQGIFQSVAYKKESVFGTAAGASGALLLPRTSLDLNLVKNTFQSARIATHQQSSGTRHGTGRVEGTYNDEISCETHKDLWAALLRNAWVLDEVEPGVLYVPQSGHTRDSFTIEGWRADINESRQFTGVRVTQAQIAVQPNGMSTVAFSLLGQNMVSSSSRYFTSPAAVPANVPASGVAGEVQVDGVGVAVITGANITINGNGETGDVIGSKITPDVFLGILQVSGDFSVYHQDRTLLEKYLNEATIALSIRLDEPGGTDFMRFSIPLVTITSYTTQDAAGAAIAQCQFTADVNMAGADDKAKSIILIEDTRLLAPSGG